jgi:PB1 domain
MGPVHFKLSMSDGLTRRISFHTRPSWSELATRIQSFCNIPRNRLAMSYLDSDGDEVTLSSEEELRDFYDSNVDNAIQGNQLIRFHVVELGSLRDTDNFMEPISPQPSSTRNTFGRPTPFVFVDHDHPPFGPFGDLFIPSPLEREVDSPHAFVEVVSDDGEKEREFSDVGDKGKARDLRPSVSDDISSSPLVIADETPRKPPIHVQVHGLRPMNSGTFGPPPATSTPPRESVTPTLRHLSSSESPEETPRDLPGSFPDPPTPELGAPIDPNVSLSNDLAVLLDSLNSMFLEHSEVGQHFRAVFRDGSYWNAQRDSVARVAEDIQRVARDAQSAVAAGAQEMGRNIRQQAQQEAARRVTESVENIMRSFGASGNELPPSNANIPGSAQMSSSTNVGPPPPPAGAGSAPVWNQFRPFPGPQGVDPSSSATYPPEVSYYTASANREARSNSSGMKTSLETAKAHYKAEKEKYRQEQETRRRERWLAKESAANR